MGRTNYADLAMGNAIFAYNATYDWPSEVGPHISAAYELKETPAGPLTCKVWREIDMASGEPVLIWASEYEVGGAEVKLWQLQDMGLMGEQVQPETPANQFTKWAAVRIRITKDTRRVIDWPTMADLHADYCRWAKRRGMAEDGLLSVKAFAGLARGLEGVEPTRMGRRGTHMVFAELRAIDDRPVTPASDGNPATYAELQAKKSNLDAGVAFRQKLEDRKAANAIKDKARIERNAKLMRGDEI